MVSINSKQLSPAKYELQSLENFACGLVLGSNLVSFPSQCSVSCLRQHSPLAVCLQEAKQRREWGDYFYNICPGRNIYTIYCILFLQQVYVLVFIRLVLIKATDCAHLQHQFQSKIPVAGHLVLATFGVNNKFITFCKL